MKKSPFLVVMVLLAFFISLSISGCNCCEPDVAIAVKWPSSSYIKKNVRAKKTVAPSKEKLPAQKEKAPAPAKKEDPIEDLDDNTPVEEPENLIEESKANLEIKIAAPTRINLQKEKEFEYNIEVVNTGKEPLTDVVLQDKVHASLVKYVSSTPKGTYQENGVVTWDVGEIPPSKSRTFKVKVVAAKRGKVLNRARVKSNERPRIAKEVSTQVVGGSGLRISHIDEPDPVELGTELVYTIEIRNWGSIDAQEVAITDIIPKETKFVKASVEGANIKYKVEGKKVIFDPIPTIVPRQKVIFRVVLKTIEEGDLLNTIKLSSKNFNKTLTSQEGTKVFSE